MLSTTPSGPSGERLDEAGMLGDLDAAAVEIDPAPAGKLEINRDFRPAQRLGQPDEIPVEHGLS